LQNILWYYYRHKGKNFFRIVATKNVKYFDEYFTLTKLNKKNLQKDYTV